MIERNMHSKNNLQEPSIIAREIRKSYFEGQKKLEVLKGIDLEIRNEEIVALTGPSGAGKSTLLHLIGLMDKTSSGDLILLNRKIQDLKDKEKDLLRNQSIGFLFQFHYLLSELTVLENVALPLRILGKKRSEAQEVAAQLLESIGLKERISHFPSEISGGEQQRTALARALVNQPIILLCDEPTGNLDLETGEKVRDLIWRVARAKHTTVLIATHNMEIAQKADRIIQIIDGQIIPENIR